MCVGVSGRAPRRGVKEESRREEMVAIRSVRKGSDGFRRERGRESMVATGSEERGIDSKRADGCDQWLRPWQAKERRWQAHTHCTAV